MVTAKSPLANKARNRATSLDLRLGADHPPVREHHEDDRDAPDAVEHSESPAGCTSGATVWTAL